MRNRIFRYAYHFTVYAIGVTVLLAAVTVTIIRLLLPDIGIYRGEVEAWVSRFMGYPVAIHSLNATWYGWTPQLHLTNIDLLNKAGTKAITHFDSADISIDPVATLLDRQFIPRHLTISGFQVSIARLASGAIKIEGIDIADVNSVTAGDNELADWLFRQQAVKIEKGTVEWVDLLHEQEPMLLTDVSVGLRSDGTRLQVEGSAQLPRPYGSRMDFAFDATGDLLTAGWSGELYMFASDINPDNWYRNYRPLNINIAGGNADIRVWSTWKEAVLASVEGELRYRDFAAMVGKTRLHIDDLRYRFAGQRTSDGGWRLNMSLNDMVTQNGLWPASNIRVHATPVPGRREFRYQIGFDYLKLDDLKPLVSQISAVPPAAREALGRMAVSGNLRNGTLTIDPGADAADQITYDVQVDQLSTRLEGSAVGVRDLSGRLSGSLDSGRIRFDHDAGHLSLPAMHLGDLGISGLAGDVLWSRDDSGIHLFSDQMALDTPDFSAQLAGTVDLEADRAPYVDLVMDLGHVDGEHIRKYIPELPNFHLRDWMQRAVLAGEVTSASALLRGRLSDFPFDDNSGRFAVLLDAENVVLEYSSAWPPVDNLSTEVSVQGRKLHALIRGGKILNADILDATASIDDILHTEKTVTVNGRVSGVTDDLDRFVEHSPLTHDPFLDRLHTALYGGDMRLALDLSVPLHEAGEKPAVSGRLDLAGAHLKSQAGNYTLNDIHGAVSFTESSAQGSGLKARFYDHPVDLTVSGSKTDDSQPPNLTVSGTADGDFIVDRLADYFPALGVDTRQSLRDRLRGACNWVMKVSYLQDPDSHALTQQLDINSDLEGLLLDLPAPMGKVMTENIPLSVTREIGTARPTDIQIRYGSILAATIHANRSSGAGFSGADLTFGEAQAPGGEDRGGLHLNGHIGHFSVSDWWKVLHPDQAGAVKPGVPDGGITANVRVDELELAGRTFQDVDLQSDATDGEWHFNLDGAAIGGAITVAAAKDRSPIISARLNRLVLAGEHAGPVSERIDPRKLFAMDIDVADLTYAERDLGHLKLKAAPVDDGISIEHFEFEKPDLSVGGNGTWLHGEEEDHSRFNIKLHARRIEDMLQTFGYNVTAIRKGETKLAIDAEWNGAPLEFNLAKLNGTLNMQIEKGQLLDVDPKAGRLFGLLSIQSLPRRLSLDFSDLFGKGLAFDTIDGNFSISNGNAYTNDLHMRAPSADVIVTGRTGLAEQDYDQLVTVTPQVANTLPVASAIFGPVGIGVGAVLYLAGEMFNSLHEGIDKLLRYQYTITGSWNDPVIEKYEAPAQASG